MGKETKKMTWDKRYRQTNEKLKGVTMENDLHKQGNESKRKSQKRGRKTVKKK